MTPLHIHVAVDGSATAAGTESDPLATLAGARDHLRSHRPVGQSAVVHIAPGRYELTEPLRFGPLDSGTTYVAEGDRGDVVIDGAHRLTGWTPGQVNDRPALVASAPTPHVKSLFALDQRLARPRRPHDGFFRIVSQGGVNPTQNWSIADLFNGSDTFEYADDDVTPMYDPTSVDAVVPHFWIVERMPLERLDTEHRRFVSSKRSMFTLRDDVANRMARYYLDNVREAMTESGTWYHDRPAGLIYYLPRNGESARDFEASVPLVDQFLIVAGDARRGDPVSGLAFERLVFRHTDWLDVERIREPYDITERLPQATYASAPQASANVAGSVEFTDSRDCALRDCAIEHTGGYGVELGFGTQRTAILGCALTDLGAGGAKLTGQTEAEHPRANRDNEISDCEIVTGGQVYPAGIGVLIRHSSRNRVTHNHIRDFHYSGVSCGWVWGYSENVAKDNHIDFNHIHDIGHGLLSDMGGIYILGVQPGTTVRGNHVHDVRCANYGGWAIYLDEGSSHVLVEGNLAHDTSTQSFHQHYGRENTIRNNVFAFGGRAQVTITRLEPHLSLTFERNIVIGDGRPAFGGSEKLPPQELAIISDLNLFWDISGTTELAGTGRVDVVDPNAAITPLGNDEWRALGHDQHSIIADPRFVDVDTRNFHLADDSPAASIGFKPLLAAEAGPRSGPGHR